MKLIRLKKDRAITGLECGRDWLEDPFRCARTVAARFPGTKVVISVEVDADGRETVLVTCEGGTP